MATTRDDAASREGFPVWYHAWTAVLAANLVIPIQFASGLFRGGGRGGMVMAIGLLWLMGALAGARSRRTRSALLAGGVGVALSRRSSRCCN